MSSSTAGSISDLRRAVRSQKGRDLRTPAPFPGHCGGPDRAYDRESAGPSASPHQGDWPDADECSDLLPASRTLEPERHKRYQSLSARITYLSIDRADLQYPAKELMRKMSCPTEADELRLKRVARYLKGVPRLVQKFPWRPLSAYLYVYVDSDFAGCHRTRKSTSGGACLWGEVCLKTCSRTQPTLALSSGEAELSAAVLGATESLGMVSVLSDFGMAASICMRSDATAAIGMVQREGLGKVRHLACSDLWIQQRIRRGDLRVGKWPGPQNPSDLGTKGLDSNSIERHLSAMGFVAVAGRALAALGLKSGAGRTAGSA